MKILLIEPYGEINKTRKLVPVGIPYMAAVLLEAGHEVQGYNANSGNCSPEESIDTILRIADEGDFDMVGMGGLCMSFPFQKTVFNRLAAQKDRPLLISGGNMFTSEPDFCMEEYGVDFGIFGEGEIPFLKLLDALKKKQDFTHIGGLYYRGGNTIRSTKIPGEVVEDLDLLPYPAYDLFYDDETILSQAVFSIYTSRSCPFNCSFCYHPVGSRYRRRSVANVVAEIKFMHAKYGKRAYFFGDELFLVDEQWVLDFCDEIEKLTCLDDWSCQTRASHVEPHILKRIKEAGCHHVRVGIESGSDTVLRSMNKKTSREDNLRAVRNIREAGINMDGGVIIGDFAETPQTLRETFDFVKETDLVPNQGMIFVTPLPGSDMWERCLKEGLITDKMAYLEDLTKPAKLRVNMTQMSDQELLGYQESGAREIFMHLAVKRKAIVKQILEVKMNQTSVLATCPTCGETDEQILAGMTLEMVRYCGNCKKPLFFNPLEVPHFAQRSTGFSQAVKALDPDGPRDILVTPSCLDFIRLSAIDSIPTSRILSFLDKSGPKTENDYFGLPVVPRDRETMASLGAKQLYIVSAQHCESISREVSMWDIPGLDIIPLYK
ncbi:B12-binding domain-containing radical SAM protein [Pseudodesulfovibrio sp.]|nr:B12-binding domain-containing radical SAM protein [Pseudodesulfovibrio sp.]